MLECCIGKLNPLGVFITEPFKCKGGGVKFHLSRGRGVLPLRDFQHPQSEANNIEEEYIIYNNIGVLSAVGGILGLLLGFSLKGILKALIFLSCF